MPTPATKLLTAEEFFELPDPNNGTRLELVRGLLVATPLISFERGEIRGTVGYHIKMFLNRNRLGRVATSSGVVLSRDPDTVRGPDVSYYSKERMPLDLRVVKYHDQPPDLCVEVVSPSNTRRELDTKVREYFFAGVRMVWVVDPDYRSVLVLTAPDEGRTFLRGATFDGGDVLPGFACKVADLFA